MIVIFVTDAFPSDPMGHPPRQGAAIARKLSPRGELLLESLNYVPQFLAEAVERDRVLSLCLEHLNLSNEVRVYGEPRERMGLEIAEARRLGILVVDGVVSEALPDNGEPPR